MVGIYIIKNKINGKVYIGQSVDIGRRWTRHKMGCTSPTYHEYDYPLYRAFRKYGIDNFEFVVLEECSKDLLNEKEKYYIEKYDALHNGYNQTPGGDCVYSEAQLQYSQDVKWDLINTTLDYAELTVKYGVSKQTLSAINNGRAYFEEGLEYPLRKFESSNSYPHEKKMNYCQICGVEISANATLCVQCAHDRQRTVERPDSISLAKEIVENGFSAVGRKYGVSDNAIRKWCKSYNMPIKKNEIKEWLLK